MCSAILNRRWKMIAENIKAYMIENNIKQGQVGLKAGMTPQALSESLMGKRKLSIDEYVSLCDALHVSVDFFTDQRELGHGATN
ncbi:helix-turn-helix domain-containing protein [Eggerthellaceae bacterium zg-893]|nr:helix-turn-helix domain-containing protein [Eggerthellaceae bacterium zg-893]